MTRSLSRAPWVLALLCLLIAGSARAQLTIEIVGGGATTIPIAIVPFASDAYPVSTTAVVSADLARSGLFKVVDAGGDVPRPSRAEEVRYGDWTSRGADAVVVGSMAPQPDGRIEVRFALTDTVKQGQLARGTHLSPPAMRAASTRNLSSPPTSRCFLRSGRRTALASPTYRSKTRSRSCTCKPCRRAGGRSSPISAAATARQPGRRTARVWR